MTRDDREALRAAFAARDRFRELAIVFERRAAFVDDMRKHGLGHSERLESKADAFREAARDVREVMSEDGEAA